jgi:hypothetical protein
MKELAFHYETKSGYSIASTKWRITWLDQLRAQGLGSTFAKPLLKLTEVESG